MSKVAVITGFHQTPRFLKTLFGHLNHQVFKNFDVYVYNNSNKDYSDFFKEQDYFFKYYFVNLTNNVGFAGGNNEAIATATKRDKYTYFALINDDTKPLPEWLSELVKTSLAHPIAGAVSSKMVFYEKFITLHCKTQTFLNMVKENWE